MNQDYSIDGRHFRRKEEYELGLKDKEKIQTIRKHLPNGDRGKAKQVLQLIRQDKIKFHTILGQDFIEELEELCDEIPGRLSDLSELKQGNGNRKLNITKDNKDNKDNKNNKDNTDNKDNKDNSNPDLDKAVKIELKKLERKRKMLRLGCTLVAVICLSLFGLSYYFENRTGNSYSEYEKLREKTLEKTYINQTEKPDTVHKTEAVKEREVLPEYKDLVNLNKKLIGWLKIDDTNIDYPVVQTTDNEFYLRRNLDGDYDKNGTIFMDKDCDILKPSTNFILYGHKMQSGAMFGKLSKYENAKYCREHQYIEFDTIYEKGIYQVMYVFRSTILNSDDVGFKYYQFIDANSEQEFLSNMEEMAKMSLVDTKVTAEYGDRLLTLSTCDYYETNGRFVVVAKKVPAKE